MSEFTNQLDQAINNEFLIVCKCILPYFDKNLQKQFAIAIKVIELINTIKFYNEDEFFSTPKEGDWQQNLLIELSNHLSPEKAQIADMIFKTMNLLAKLHHHDQSTSSHHAADPTPQRYSNLFEQPFNTETVYPQFHAYQEEPAQRFPNPQSIHMPKSVPLEKLDPIEIFNNLAPSLDENQLQMLIAFTTSLGV